MNGVKYSRKVYGIADVLRDLGGLFVSITNGLALLLLPYQKFAFILEITKQFFHIKADSDYQLNYKNDVKKEIFIKSSILTLEEKAEISSHESIETTWGQRLSMFLALICQCLFKYDKCYSTNCCITSKNKALVNIYKKVDSIVDKNTNFLKIMK